RAWSVLLNRFLRILSSVQVLSVCIALHSISICMLSSGKFVTCRCACMAPIEVYLYHLECDWQYRSSVLFGATIAHFAGNMPTSELLNNSNSNSSAFFFSILIISHFRSQGISKCTVWH